MLSDMLVWSLGLLLHSESVSGSNPPAGRGLPVWSLHLVPVPAWVLSGFLPQSKHTHYLYTRLAVDFKLYVGANVVVCLYMSVL